MKTNRSALQFQAILMSAVLLYTGIATGQEPNPAGSLTITVVEGDDPIFDVRQRVNREAIVKVEDENHRPVAGAIVLFMAPDNGPSATFQGGLKTVSTTTDSQGRAVLRGIRPNQSEGKFQIRVTASKDGKTGSTTINASNMVGAGAAASAGAGLSTKGFLTILAIGGAAAAVGIAVGLNGGGNRTATPPIPISLNPGTVTVGPPR